MKNKFSLISVAIVLLFLTLSVYAQENPSTIDNLLTTARERQRVARDNYTEAVEKNNPQQEQDSLKAAWEKATGEVKDLEKIKAQLSSTRMVEPSPTPSPSSSPNPSSTPSPSPSPSPSSTPSNSGGDTAATGSTTIEDEDCEKREGTFSQRICEIARDIKQRGNVLDLSRNEYPLALLIYGQVVSSGGANPSEAIRKFILDAEEKRTDKQVGSDSNSKGTTSIVVKGGVPNFFNFATENGAATRTISGTTVTFRFNPIGLLQVLPNYNPNNFLEGYWDDFEKIKNPALAKWLSNPNRNESEKPDEFIYKSKWTDYLRKLSFGLSFDASRGQEVPTLVGTERQLSVFSLRYEFFNDRNPRSPKWKQKWDEFFDKNNPGVVKESEEQIREIYTTDEDTDIRTFDNKDLKIWFEQLIIALKNLPSGASMTTIETALRGQLALLPVNKIKDDATLLNAFESISKIFIAYFEKRKELLSEIAKAPVMTFEYTNNREPILPDTHNFNFIFAKGFSLGAGKDAPVMDLTFNASLTFLNKKPAGMDVKRIRDFSFAGQLDVPLFSSVEDRDAENSLYGTTFSFAGKYQRLTGDLTALDGTVLPNTKGDIWVGQAKLIIPLNFGFLKGKGIMFPFSATWANRTELVRESRVRGNFGITFDLDKLILNNLLGNMK